ncbi:metal ABC transporter permease [Candidatus Pacearchaeota archaeon]|nr:metal ABC transporter permease [Candidatus Pacearchaeota archaeon]|tara:strand:+ start:6372 stop:8183 length:1812 start_codon:yes stop_codon:yes gene_type:complete
MRFVRRKKKNKNDDRRIDLKRNMRIYWEIVSKYKWFYFFVILMVFIVEGVHIVEKYLFKIVIDRGTEFSAGTIASEILVGALLGVAAVYLSLLLVKAISQWFKIHLANLFEGRMLFDLKRRYFNHIIHLGNRFHTSHKTGSLISRLTRGSRGLEGITDFIIYDVAPLLLQFALLSVAFFYLDVTSTIVLALTIFCFIGFSVIISLKQQTTNLIANEAEDREKANIADVFMNIDSIKYYGKENFIKNRFAKIADNSKKWLIKLWHYGRWFNFGQSLILGIGTFFLFYFPLIKFLDGGITIGTVAFIYTAYGGLLGPLYGFVHSLRRLYMHLADVQDLFDYEKINNDIEDKVNAPKLKVKKGKIDFEGISFKYHDRKVINNVSLEINPGEKIALVGHSGSGKTTLVKLLYRLYDTDTGKIKIDGLDIRDVRQESLRGELSIVPQEAILFDDTIFENIRFSRPSATKAEVLRAMRFAQLDKFVKLLPQRENTIVGERGVKLSGGEKQRVSIARAILANKKILVLDEATSALDSKTEWEIQKDLKRLMEGRTSIIIAHRLSTIMHADKIVVMDKGRIVQLGKHNELINKPGVYKELWNLQKGGYIEE